ncbi:MAG: hypothetical protein ACLUQ6_00775 [Alistipes onderdonkii]
MAFWLLGGMAVRRMRHADAGAAMMPCCSANTCISSCSRPIFGRRRGTALSAPAPPRGARRLLIKGNRRQAGGGDLRARPAPLRRIVVQYGLDGWLLRRIRFAPQGHRRALPGDTRSTAARRGRSRRRSRPLTRSRNWYVRFYALMTQLAAEPATSLRRMAEYDYPFSACSLPEIMAMLRR